MTREEIAQDLNYTRYYRRAGVAWTAGTILPLPDGQLLVFDLGRSAELGPYDAAAIHQLDAIRPHLARAAMMSARLGLDGARAMAESLALLAGVIPFQPPSD